MKLDMVSLRGAEYEGEIVSLTIPTDMGEITILDHHRPLVALVARGVAMITDPRGGQTALEVAGGFLEVNEKNSVRVLLD